MIRGALASRYGIGALGRGVIRPASGGWWLSGGIAAANCIAAYQAKGAADYAASKVNLANPGTYNLVEIGGAVNWSASVGWSGFSTLSRCLDTKIANIINQSSSAVIRVTDVSNNSTVMFGGYDNAADGIYFAYFTSTGWQFFLNQGPVTQNVATSTGTGVLAIAGPDYFLDGIDKGNFSQTANTLARSPYIGAQHYTTPVQYTNGSIQAVSVYNSTITPAQVAAVSNAMAAL